MDFAIPVGHGVNLKENEKKDKYIDLVIELKNCGTWIVIGALSTVAEGLLKRLEDLNLRERVGTIQTTT